MRGNEVTLARAIRGPITLITLGGLFAMNNFTEYQFRQTWPVLLIVFGLLSLLRRGTEPAAPVAPPVAAWPPPPPPPPPSAPEGGTYRQSQFPAPPPSSGDAA
jgi:hypothetical protein